MLGVKLYRDKEAKINKKNETEYLCRKVPQNLESIPKNWYRYRRMSKELYHIIRIDRRIIKFGQNGGEVAVVIKYALIGSEYRFEYVL